MLLQGAGKRVFPRGKGVFLALPQGEIAHDLAHAVRLAGEQDPPFARRFKGRFPAAVLFEFLVEREQNSGNVRTISGQFRGKVDEICLSLGASDPYEAHKVLRGLFPVAGPAAGTGGADGRLQPQGDAPLSVVLAVGQKKGVFNFAEEGGDLVQPLPDGAPVAVDGYAREHPFAVKEQAFPDLFKQLPGEDANERGGQNAGEQMKHDLRRGEGVHAREVLRGEVGERQGEGGGDASVGGDEQGAAGVDGEQRQGKRAHFAHAERQGQDDGKRHRHGVFKQRNGKKHAQKSNSRVDETPQSIADPHAEDQPQKGGLRQLRARQTALVRAHGGAQAALRERGGQQKECGDDGFLRKDGQGEQRISRMGKQKDERDLGEGGESDPPHAGVLFQASAHAVCDQQHCRLCETADGRLPRKKDGRGGKVGGGGRKADAEDGKCRPHQQKRGGFALRKGKIHDGHSGGQRKKERRSAQRRKPDRKMTHRHLGFFTKV